MKNITLFIAVIILFVGCSKDDMVSQEPNEQTAEIKTKSRTICTDLNVLKLKCSSNYQTKNSPLTFTWNSIDLNYVFNRVYKSYIQIESNGCSGNNSSVNIPIHFFTTSSYTLDEGHNETCFKYRVVVLGYDRGQMACESISHWQVFNYNKIEVDTVANSGTILVDLQ